jgi:hypothetical protein
LQTVKHLWASVLRLPIFAVGWHCSTDTGTMATLFQELTAAGCEIGSHESDLHVKCCEKALTIIVDHVLLPGSTLQMPNQFVSNTDNSLWWDIPFAYDPFWQK